MKLIKNKKGEEKVAGETIDFIIKLGFFLVAIAIIYLIWGAKIISIFKSFFR